MGKIIAVASGKGGTGKTSFTACVGLSLAAMGYETLALDCDITLRNLDLALGLSDSAAMDFSDVLEGRCTLEAAAVLWGRGSPRPPCRRWDRPSASSTTTA